MEQMVRQFGPAVRFHYAFRQWAYLFTSPEHYRRILVEHQQNYTKQHPVYAALGVALGNGLVTSDGGEWLRNRRMIQPAFHSRSVRRFGSLIVRHAQLMLDRWDRADSNTIDVDREMMRLTLAIVGEALFGVALEGHTKRVDEAFSSFNAALALVTSRPLSLISARYPLTAPSRQLHNAARRLRAVVDEIIVKKQEQLSEGAPPADLLGFLLSSDRGDPMPLAQVRDETMTLLLAGHETTATALTWALYLISEHKEVSQRIAEELESVLCGRTADVNDIPKLLYVRAAALEAMRLYPPIYAFERQAIAEDVIGGYHVPAGASITLCPYITHRTPEFWEAPERFLPERFRGHGRHEKFSYIPFSAGLRGCIGEGFAMTEILLVLATILQRYQLRRRPNLVVEPAPLITLRPAGGMPMVALRLN
jgi:cytochrome P450